MEVESRIVITRVWEREEDGEMGDIGANFQLGRISFSNLLHRMVTRINDNTLYISKLLKERILNVLSQKISEVANLLNN